MSEKECTGSDDEHVGKRRQALHGFLHMILVTLSNLMADIISKVLVEHFSIFLIAMMRGFVMLLFVTPVMIYYFSLLRDSVSQWKELSLRGTMSALSALVRVAALSFAPLGDISAINAITPILTALWSWLMLGEAITLLELGFAAISMVGICLIAQPPDLFSSSTVDSNRVAMVLGIGLATLGAIFASLGIVLNRKLSQCDIYVSPAVQVFYYSFISTFINITALGATFALGFTHAFPDTSQGLCLLSIGFLGLLKQLFLIAALRQEKAIFVTTFVYSSSIVLAYIVQYLYFHNNPTILSVIGASLCIAGTLGFVLPKLQD